jgi:hydrogenase maturation factor
MVGGATVLATGDLDKYVSPKFARIRDKIIITKGPAIEASGIFATMFPKFLTEEFGEEFVQKAQPLFYKMSVVDDAMTAVKTGVRDEGVSAMHDATECGIWGGVFEIAQAAEVGIRIEKEKIVVEEGVNDICSLFKIDPYKSISEGTLIITCREKKAESLVEILKNNNIKASIVGELIDSKFGMLLIENGKEKKLEHPRVDPFWKAFYNALKRYKEVES